MSYRVLRQHEIAMGHRVFGHEGKCKHPHGHNYVFEFVLEADQLDEIGRVIDFGVIKTLLCDWLEKNWDHKFMVFRKDPLWKPLFENDPDGLVLVSYNPTVENIAKDFVEDIAPGLLYGSGARLVTLRVWETGKCSTIYACEGKSNDGKVGNGRSRGEEVLR